jgi:hypothetical protein
VALDFPTVTISRIPNHQLVIYRDSCLLSMEVSDDLYMQTLYMILANQYDAELLRRGEKGAF